MKLYRFQEYSCMHIICIMYCVLTGIQFRSHCETHEDWCLWFQGFSQDLQNAQHGRRDQSAGPGSEVDELALWLSSDRAAPDKLSHCSVSQLCQVQNWWTENRDHQFQKKRPFFFFFLFLRINISCGTSNMAVCLCRSAVNRWAWWVKMTNWLGRPHSKPTATSPERSSECLCNLWLMVSLKTFLPKQINTCLEQLILILIWEICQEFVF